MSISIRPFRPNVWKPEVHCGPSPFNGTRNTACPFRPAVTRDPKWKTACEIESLRNAATRADRRFPPDTRTRADNLRECRGHLRIRNAADTFKSVSIEGATRKERIRGKSLVEPQSSFSGEKRAIFRRGRRIPEADLGMEVGHAALTHRHDDKIVISGVIISPQPTAPARIIGRDAIGVRLALSP